MKGRVGGKESFDKGRQDLLVLADIEVRIKEVERISGQLGTQIEAKWKQVWPGTKQVAGTHGRVSHRSFCVSPFSADWPATAYDGGMKLTIELDREDDGRWIAEAAGLPGVMCYGRTRDEAIGNIGRLTIEVIADRIAHGELRSSSLAVCFAIPDEQLASH